MAAGWDRLAVWANIIRLMLSSQSLGRGKLWVRDSSIKGGGGSPGSGAGDRIAEGGDSRERAAVVRKASSWTRDLSSLVKVRWTPSAQA